MHHSRISTLMIDCMDSRFEDCVLFWSRALGLPVKRRPSPNQRYLNLGAVEGPLEIRLQRVARDSGFHIDIETDAIPEERARLAALDAHPRERIKSWWVMEDPSGNPFCLVRPESDVLFSAGKQWDGATGPSGKG